MYITATGDLAFGDIFEADWFFSAYLKRDAVPLVEFTPSKPKVERAWQVAKPSPHRDYLFAHGQQRRAILLADDCEAETIVKRKGAGRLVFAAVEALAVAPSERERQLATTAFRQFPLPAGDGFAGGVVHFQQLFAVSVEAAISSGKDPRVARLDPDARIDFEMRWNAYAVRRGPLSHRDNAEKLARVLSAAGETAKLQTLKAGKMAPEDQYLAVGIAVARALGFAWDIEGGALNDIGDVHEGSASLDPARDQLLSLLKSLASSSQRAAALLEAAYPPSESPS